MKLALVTALPPDEPRVKLDPAELARVIAKLGTMTGDELIEFLRHKCDTNPGGATLTVVTIRASDMIDLGKIRQRAIANGGAATARRKRADGAKTAAKIRERWDALAGTKPRDWATLIAQQVKCSPTHVRRVLKRT